MAEMLTPAGRMLLRAQERYGRAEAGVARLTAALRELRSAMVRHDHPINPRRADWTRAPQYWIDAIDAALAREPSGGTDA